MGFGILGRMISTREGSLNIIELHSSVFNKHARPKSISRLWRIEESQVKSEVFSERERIDESMGMGMGMLS